MKMPNTMKTYCPQCKATTTQKVKTAKKGRTRNTSEGKRKHIEKQKGYTSSVAGKKKVYKQAKRPTVILTCTTCNKKRPKTIGARTKKILEITTG